MYASSCWRLFLFIGPNIQNISHFCSTSALSHGSVYTLWLSLAACICRIMLPVTQNTWFVNFLLLGRFRINLLFFSLQLNRTRVHMKPEPGHLSQMDLVQLFWSVTKCNCCVVTCLNKLYQKMKTNQGLIRMLSIVNVKTLYITQKPDS